MKEQPRSQGPLSPSRKYPGCGWSRVHLYKSTAHRGWVFYLILSTVKTILSRGRRKLYQFFKMAFAFLSGLQVALLSAGYDNIILKVKQVICLEALYLRKDLVPVLPTGYGKSLIFHVLPRLLKERDTMRSFSCFAIERPNVRSNFNLKRKRSTSNDFGGERGRIG